MLETVAGATGESLILRGTTVLDRGADVDAAALRRAGLQVTCIRGGVLRTAPSTGVR